MKTIKTLFVLLIIAVVGLGVYVYSGAYDIGADVPHTRFVYWLMSTLRDRSIAAHARDIRVPDLNDPKMILEGAGQYAAMCSTCHLAPGYDQSETWEGLYPRPPKLYQGTSLTPAEIFWVIKHGIKLSGMPAWGASHEDDELWAVTAFVMQLPKLSPQQYKDMVARAPMDTDMTMMPMPGGESPVPHHADGNAVPAESPARVGHGPQP
ncbi:MAG: cytochrome c [Sinobacteraceae bacterium]|nr:cytochrome c [Nevskiaceae bacterium]